MSGCLFFSASMRLPVAWLVTIYRVRRVHAQTIQDTHVQITALPHWLRCHGPSRMSGYECSDEPAPPMRRLSCRSGRYRAAALHFHFYIFIHLADGFTRSDLKCVQHVECHRNHQKVEEKKKVVLRGKKQSNLHLPDKFNNYGIEENKKPLKRDWGPCSSSL